MYYSDDKGRTTQRPCSGGKILVRLPTGMGGTMRIAEAGLGWIGHPDIQRVLNIAAAPLYFKLSMNYLPTMGNLEFLLGTNPIDDLVLGM